jgi:hypothetical protein
MSARNALKFCLALCAFLWGLPGIGVLIQFFTGGGYPFSQEAAATMALAGCVPAFAVLILACGIASEGGFLK